MTYISWGDAPGWVALIVAIWAAWTSHKARKVGDRSAVASERSAAAAEGALEDQRRQAAEQRAAEEHAVRPRVQLLIEQRGKERYALRNEGNVAAENIVCLTESGALLEWPDGLRLEPGERHPFITAPSFGDREPTRLQFTWDGQADPVTVPMP